MSRQRSPGETESRDVRPRSGDAGADHPVDEPARPGAHGGDVRHDRLDTIEWADDRTRSLDRHSGTLGEEPVDDLLEGGETDATYRKGARHVTPTIDPASERDDER